MNFNPFLNMLLCFITIVSAIGNNSTREIDLDYEDETTYGGMVSGSWSIGGYDSKYTYECSGISGATDC